MGPYTEHDPFHDPFVMFAYLAGITERIRFATGILVLPQRQTALVARQAADVDLLSGGRLRLGVGVGWNYVEYEALGQDFHTRGARQEEQIELLRRFFTEPVVDFSGRFDRVDRASSCRSRRGWSRSGSVDLARKHSIGPPDSGMASSSSAAAIAPSTPGNGCAIGWQPRPAGRRLRRGLCGPWWVRRRRAHEGNRGLARGRRHPCICGHDGPRPGLSRRSHRLPGHRRTCVGVS